MIETLVCTLFILGFFVPPGALHGWQVLNEGDSNAELFFWWICIRAGLARIREPVSALRFVF